MSAPLDGLPVADSRQYADLKATGRAGSSQETLLEAAADDCGEQRVARAIGPPESTAPRSGPNDPQAGTRAEPSQATIPSRQ